MRAARLCESGEAVLGQVLAAANRLAYGGIAPAPRHRPEAGWLPELACWDADLLRIEERLAPPDAPHR